MSNYQRRPRVEVPSIAEWKYTSNRLFEKYIGFQALMYVFLIVSSQYIFGFDIASFSSGYILFCKFLAFLVILAGMYCVPFITKYLIGQGNAGQASVLEEIAAEDDEEERDFLILEARLNGCLPPSRKQEIALFIIAGIFLFEMFYIDAWTKNGELIWYPQWLQHLVDWMKDNTGVYPDDIRKKLFILDFDDAPTLAQSFSNERIFLTMATSDRFFVFSLLRIFTFPIVFYCLCVISWDMVSYLGMEKLNPNNAQTDERLVFLFLISAFMIFIGFMAIIFNIWFPAFNMKMI